MQDEIRLAAKVPFAIERSDRVRPERYYDAEFFELENKLFWPRVWQMACRLEEIPNPGDYTEYMILDRSVIVVRVDAETVRAFENTCRHRGVRLVSDSGNATSGFTCPFHGWCWNLNGENTFMYQPDLFDPDQREPEDIRLPQVRVEIALGCAFINFDDEAPALSESLEPFGSDHDAWHVEDLKAEWWLSCELPTNWKLAMEAFMEGYHVMETHPQLMAPGHKQSAGSGAVYRALETLNGTTGGINLPVFRGDSRAFIDANIRMLRGLSAGMGGMVHAEDIEVAETLRDLDLSGDPENASFHWFKALVEAITAFHVGRGERMPDLLNLAQTGKLSAVNYGFPNFFLLPMFASASSYRIRPLTAETCLFELWSLKRYPPDAEYTSPEKPKPAPPDDPQWPPIPAQDFSNLPAQQLGLHNPGFPYMRLSDKVEGMIGNYQRLIDGYLAGLDHDQLLAAMQQVSGPIDAPVRDLGF